LVPAGIHSGFAVGVLFASTAQLQAKEKKDLDVLLTASA